MPQLLLELFSEEIPARMQAQAGRDLERMARERLTAAELNFEGLRAYAGPRRLTLVVDGLPTAQADRTEERKGPRANAPDQALQGFLRSTGLTREELVERDGVLFATLHRAGRPTPEIIAEMVEAIVRNFPWPKSMRWGSGQLRWVRPLQRILCVFDGEIVPFSIDGIESGDLSEGHRFMGGERAPFAARDFDTYAKTLAERFVVLDPAERRARIAAGAQKVCAAKGLEWVQDEGLLDEVTGLAEWPVPILGDMDPDFLDLPAEVIRTSMRTHQRYFAVRDPKTGTLAPHFVVTANIEPTDGGAVIAHGNARVLTARLSDARFFWDEDRRGGNFERWAKKLNGVTFHAKLGTMAERVARITALAQEIAPLVGADVRLTEIAAKLCKADLASGMVGEFPELQGIMGGYYARQPSPAEAKAEAAVAGLHASADGSEDPLATIDQIVEASANHHWSHGLTQYEIDIVADAVRDHYKPIGPSDTVPTAPVTVAVALADKLDTLVGFFAIDERPTGSRDPFALRRAALGVIRLALASGQALSLKSLIGAARARAEELWRRHTLNKYAVEAASAGVSDHSEVFTSSMIRAQSETPFVFDVDQTAEHLLAFFADRLKVSLRDEGKRHDLVDAVFALGDDDLVRIVARVEALDGFLHTEDGASLLAGYRRAANILKAEAKKAPGEDYALNWDLDLLSAPEEQALSASLRTVLGEVDRALDGEDFEGAMRFLSHLRTPVDAFFDKVLVNDPDPAVRLNRLRLLSAVRDTANRVADFSLVSNA
jgi:glycyl-tRNA synthetase beta chain